MKSHLHRPYLAIPLLAAILCALLAAALTAGAQAPPGAVLDSGLDVTADWGDAPDLPQGAKYPTLSTNGGAAHALVAKNPTMGACVDPEADGQPSLDALGDDASNTAPPCSDDEDGVTFPVAPLVPGDPQGVVRVDMAASPADCLLSAWLDFDGNGSWDHASEQIFDDMPLAKGSVHDLTFPILEGAAPGETYARFRCSTQSGLAAGGPATDGEVEDYRVVIAELEDVDWGDAPDGPYPTLALSGGASHVLGGPWMGACVDPEPNGLPSTGAKGDDATDNGCTDDEDGIEFATHLVRGTPWEMVWIDLRSSPEGCYFSGWIDFDQNGSWDEPGEQILSDAWLIASAKGGRWFEVPSTALTGTTYARFRCSSDAGLDWGGRASDGEVEDHVVTILEPEPLDWGDAPDMAQGFDYQTLGMYDGANHALVGGGPLLGACVDIDPDGQASWGALGDDENDTGCANDDDGVTFAGPLVPGDPSADVAIDASGSPQDCLVRAWMDFDSSRTWDAGELIIDDELVGAGEVVTISFAIPRDAVPGETFTRFRCSTEAALDFHGPAADGEVEDYLVTIEDSTALDWGDAPDDPTVTVYPTLMANGGASHWLDAVGPLMGACVDAESDGQPLPDALGDDASNTGCSDDEDGVSFDEFMYRGSPRVWLTVDLGDSPSDCVMNAWVDFDASGSWDQPEEQIFADLTLSAGLTHNRAFAVPDSAIPGWTYARFRCSSQAGLVPTGPAPDGEVEDYRVAVAEPEPADWGDAPDWMVAYGYPTMRADDGASHLLLPGGPFMGPCVDPDGDGQPGYGATQDDVHDTAGPGCSDDEDGVTFPSPLVPGMLHAPVRVDLGDSPAGCNLNAWLDFDDSRSWEPEEQIFAGLALSAGQVHSLTFEVPLDAALGATYSRFRCSTDPALEIGGEAVDGEVEDHEVKIEDAVDWGDAPDELLIPGYPTLAANNGASHLHVGSSDPFMGACRDGEPNGQPSSGALGDDDNDTGCGDDEDGITLPGLLLVGDPSAQVTIDLSGSPNYCHLNAWIDFDGDGSWDQPEERIFSNMWLAQGAAHVRTFEVPETATPGPTYARFRCSMQEDLGPGGQAWNGEVEDYQVTIEDSAALDWGDAPDDPGDAIYPTLLANDGASHLLVPAGPLMGACVDAEADGQPSLDAEGDDTSDTGCADDEDGVTFDEPLYRGSPRVWLSVDLRDSPEDCVLNAWIDLDADGAWDQPEEHIFDDLALSAGTLHEESFAVTDWAVPGPTFARFRCSTQSGLGTGGSARDGEVEDYQIEIVEPESADWGDAPDWVLGSGYPTMRVNGGASHLLVAEGPFMGLCVDPDGDGQPGLGATQDDLHDTAGPGCSDDEDGVAFPSRLVPGTLDAPVQVDLSSSPAGCSLSAWLDFDASGSWESEEQIFAGEALSAGVVHTLTVEVPLDAAVGSTYARFRCSTEPGLAVGGQAADGEVEDYQVLIDDLLWRVHLPLVLRHFP